MTIRELIEHHKWVMNNTALDRRFKDVEIQTIDALEIVDSIEQTMNGGNELPDDAVLRRASIPLVEYLKKYYNPNAAAIITPRHIEVLSEKQVLFFD